MTLPVGQISLGQVNTELGLSSTTTISLNQASVRALAGVPSGQIAMSNLQGKSNISYFGTLVYPSTSSQFYVNGTPAIDSSGNYYMWGRIGDTPTGSALIKLNATGTIQWARYIKNDTDTNFTGTDIVIASSGNIYLLAFANNTSSYNPTVLKYNSSGTLQWVNVITQDNNYPHAIALDSSENVYLACGSANSFGNSGGRILKLNSSGTRQWVYEPKGDAGEQMGNYGIKVDSSGNIYVFSRIGNASYKGILTKLNSSVGVTWTRGLGGGTTNYNGEPTQGNCVTIGSTGDVYVVSCNTTDNTVFTTKYNSSGTQQWSRQIALGASALNLYTGGIQIDSSDNVYICYSSANTTPRTLGLAKYNSSGTIQWQRKFTVTNAGNQNNVRSIAVGSAISYIFNNSAGSPSASDLFNFAVPLDGSKTGTYTVGSSSVTYASTSFTESAGTITSTTVTGSATSSTPSAGTASYTEASYSASQQGPTAL